MVFVFVELPESIVRFSRALKTEERDFSWETISIKFGYIQLSSLLTISLASKALTLCFVTNSRLSIFPTDCIQSSEVDK